jgi:hypothetical protein
MRILTIALMAAVALTSLQAASAQTRVKPQETPPPGMSLQKKAPMPDLHIPHAGSVGGSDTKFMVQVKNSGAVDSPAAQLRGKNMNPHRLSVTLAQVPPIKAGQFVWVAMELDTPARRHDSLQLRVDPNNAIAESDEGNNFRLFNW